MKNIIFVIICFVFLTAALRGNSGNPNKNTITDSSWTSEGPFELSPERGRFSLTFSLVEDKSFQFSLPIARFAVPDLGYIDGKYVSLFAPGISFLIIPGYLIGKYFGSSQVGAFAVISFFAVLNVLLIKSIATKLGAKKLYSILAGLIFLFATPAFTYAVSLYQHHVSVFLLLSGVWVYLNYESVKSNFIIWFLVALSISVDYPNFFMMIPLMVFSILRVFKLEEFADSYKIRFKYSNLISIFGIVIPLLFLGWVNTRSYGDPLRLSGTVRNARSINEQGLPEWNVRLKANDAEDVKDYEGSNSVALGFFNSRNISNGIFIHIFSPDRGILFYTPVVLFSMLGAYILYIKNSKATALLISSLLINLFIYSMWGDPWGGWAFGSRYLIPLYAYSSILIALGFDVILKRKFLKVFFIPFLIYSISVNTLGAITSSANPPKVEVLALEELSGREEKYTFERNLDYLMNGSTKSYFYNSFLKDYITPTEFYILMTSSLIVIIVGLFSYDLLVSKLPSTKFTKSKFGKDIKNVIVDGNDTPFPISNKLQVFENNIIFNWGKVISLWKNL